MAQLKVALREINIEDRIAAFVLDTYVLKASTLSTFYLSLAYNEQQ